MNEVMAAIVAGLFSSITALITILIEKNKKIVDLVKNEGHFNKIQSTFNDVFFSSRFLTLTQKKIKEIFKKTRAERFLILYAINGKTSFNTVTVCYEMGFDNKIVWASEMYDKFEIDNPYRSMLKRVEFDHSIILDVAKMEECFLKTVYQSQDEQICHSIICFISRIKINENDDLLIYMSIATKSIDCFEKNELITIKRNCDQIRGASSNIIIH
jgi:hypothetical protein